jgi:hypothetical protein
MDFLLYSLCISLLHSYIAKKSVILFLFKFILKYRCCPHLVFYFVESCLLEYNSSSI